MAFREVGVHEVREVLRLWLRGEGSRSVARLARVDRKTVRRYVAAARACGLDRAGGEGQLGDELLSRVAERVRPHRADGHGRSWVLLAAHHAQFKELLDGGLTVVKGGILLLFLSPHAIQHLVRALTAHELSEDPHDLIARYLLHTTAHLSHGTTIFGAIYLLSHGIAKIVLVALVLRDRLWAYPWLIVLLLAFIAYQLYRITAVHFSIGLTLLTIFDAFLVWLTWPEYRAKRDRRHQVMAPAAARSSQDQPGAGGGGLERAAEVVDGADAAGAGEQPGDDHPRTGRDHPRRPAR